MRKAILSLILVLCFVSAGLANQIGVSLEKGVNAGYELSVPVIIDAQSTLPFLPKAYFKGTPYFTAQRGDFFKQMGALNHSRFDGVVGCGITLFKGNLEFETGGSYWWAGNNEGIPEGWEWENALRWYWNWN